MKISMAPLTDKSEMPVFSDKYLNDKEKIKQMEQWCEPYPVDMNVGFVPVEKDAEGNLKKVEENIGGRFSL